MRTYLPSKPGKASVYFLLAYWIVTLFGIVLTIVMAAIYKPPSAEELGVPFSQAPAYLMTLPYHPLLNLAWIPSAWMYLVCYNGDNPLQEAIKLGAFWTVICMLIDLVGWIIIPHPWAMTFREFYIDYQPWITGIYLVIFASPIAAYYLRQAFSHQPHYQAHATGGNK